MSTSVDQSDSKLASTYSCNESHKEDAHALIFSKRYACIAIADGVTSAKNSGRLSNEVMKRVKKAFVDHYGDTDSAAPDFEIFLQTLLYYCRDISGKVGRRGKTTLSLVVACKEPIEIPDTKKRFKIDYYCLGDSPIIVCARQPLSPEFPKSFVCWAIHDQPLLTDTGANLYSYFDGDLQKPFGKAHMGTFYIEENDVCVVMSDGIPMKDAIYRDIESDFRFLNNVVDNGAEDGIRWMEKYLKNNPPTDDATLGVLCMKHGIEPKTGDIDPPIYRA